MQTNQPDALGAMVPISTKLLSLSPVSVSLFQYGNDKLDETFALAQDGSWLQYDELGSFGNGYAKVLNN